MHTTEEKDAAKAEAAKEHASIAHAQTVEVGADEEKTDYDTPPGSF